MTSALLAVLMLMNMLGVYLAAVLVHLRTFCLLCVASYVINVLLLACVVMRRRELRQARTDRKRR